MRVIGLVIGAVMVMLVVAVGFANAGIDQAGTTAANFLSLGSGTRVLSMGGAAIGLGDDLGSSTWNIASLGYVNRMEVVFSHSSLGDGTMQEWAGIGGRLRGGATRWSLSGLYQGNGSFEGRDASNLPTGSFNASSFAFGAHLARRFGEVVSIGGGAKVVSENLGTVSGFGVTFDFGASAHAGAFGFGVAGQNVGGQMHYESTPYRFPSNIGAGISYSLPVTGLRLAVDANFPQAYYSDVRMGAEYLWHDAIAIRAGYRHEMSDAGTDPLTGPTFGLGAGWNGMWMDYGYIVSSTGEAQHRLGFRLFPGHGGVSDGGSYGQTDQPSIAPPAPKRTTYVAPKPATPKPASIAPAEPKSTPSTTPATTKSTPATTPNPTGSKPAGTSSTETTKANAPVPKAATPTVTGAATTGAAASTVTKAATKPAGSTATTKTTAPATTTTKPEAPAKSSAAPKTDATKTASAPATRSADASGPVAVVTPVTKPAAPAAKPAPAPAKPTPAKPSESKKADTPESEKSQGPEPVQSLDEPKASDDAKASDAKPAASAKAPEAKPADAPKPAEVKAAPVEEPAAAPAKEKSNQKAKPRPSKIKVGSKDTLDSIAKEWGVSKAAIMMGNDLTNDKVHSGQTLKLPAAGR